MNKAVTFIQGIEFLQHLPKIGISDIIEIILLTIIFYGIIKNVKGTRAWILLKGVVILLTFYMIAYIANFTVIVTIFQSLILFIGFALMLVIQPELRKLVEGIGTKNINISIYNILHNIFKVKVNNKDKDRFSDTTIQELVKGCFIMGKAKTGALIVIERDIPLNEYVATGIKVNADITSQLLINIFEKNTPLHDGAVIIQNDRVSAATCYLPLSDSKKINKDLGTRHRAGIGLSESTDGVVIIVSEETGAVSIAKNGKLMHNIDREKLTEELRKIQKVKDTETIKVSKNIIDKNFGMRVASLLAAFVTWIMVITNTNPVVTVTLKNVPIEVINQEAVEDAGKTYDIMDSEYVTVRVKDRKDITDKLTNDDIKVIADMSKISFVNSVPLEVEAPGYPDAEIILSQQAISVSIEDIVTTEVDIEINQVGDINENYYVSGIELDNNTLIISGAKSLISTIGSVKVDIDESQFTSNSEIILTPKIFDKNGEQLQNSKFTLNHDTVKANIYLYKTKKIPLNITTEIKNDNIKRIIDSIDYQEKTITITGPDDIINACDKMDISIPLDISVEDVSTGQFIKNISLQSYMPNGIIIIPQSSKANLIVDFKEFYTKQINFNIDKINIEGLSEKYTATIDSEEISIIFFNTSNVVDSVSLDTTIPYIDISNLGVGEHTVKINFRNVGTNMYETQTVKVTIKETHKG